MFECNPNIVISERYQLFRNFKYLLPHLVFIHVWILKILSHCIYDIVSSLFFIFINFRLHIKSCSFFRIGHNCYFVYADVKEIKHGQEIFIIIFNMICTANWFNFRAIVFYIFAIEVVFRKLNPKLFSN